MTGKNQPLLMILGPTASGKTKLSLAISAAIPSEIISADSRLLYRGMDIGTAKPTLEEREVVPHHLIDVADPTEVWSLARYLKAFEEIISEMHQRNVLPILVGGTGQYITAVIEGWDPPPKASDDRYRKELEEFSSKYGSAALHEKLKKLDPESARLIDSRNIRRVIRALEIIRITGIPASRARRKDPPSYQVMKIGLDWPREELYARIDERIDKMLAEGWVGEVRALLESGVEMQTPSMSAIGYRQLGAFLEGECSFEQAVVEIRKLSRQFVRRQANWFKRDDPTIAWYEAREGVEAEIIQNVKKWLERLNQ